MGRFLRSLSRGGGGGSERSGRSASKSRVSRLQQQQSEVAAAVEKRSTSVPPRRKAEDEPSAVAAAQAAASSALPRRAGSLKGSVYKSDLVSAVGTKLEVGFSKCFHAYCKCKILLDHPVEIYLTSQLTVFIAAAEAFSPYVTKVKEMLLPKTRYFFP